MQSPIDVETHNTHYDINLTPFNFINYEMNVQWNVRSVNYMVLKF
jgi:hypothetical protein